VDYDEHIATVIAALAERRDQLMGAGSGSGHA